MAGSSTTLRRHLIVGEEGSARSAASACGEVSAVSPAAAPAHRLLVRRLLRGRLGLRPAGCGHGRDPDRPRLLAACGLRPLAHREYRAGRLRRAWHADRGLSECDRPRSLSSWRDGRATIAVLLADRAVLADLGFRRLARHARSLARGPCLRRVVRGPAVSDLQL